MNVTRKGKCVPAESLRDEAPVPRETELEAMPHNVIAEGVAAQRTSVGQDLVEEHTERNVTKIAVLKQAANNACWAARLDNLPAKASCRKCIAAAWRPSSPCFN